MQEANALAAWMPHTITATLLLGAIGMLWRTFAKRLDKMETTIELVKERMPAYATTAQLEEVKQGVGRLGDRMDGRVTNVTERVAVLEALLKHFGVKDGAR